MPGEAYPRQRLKHHQDAKGADGYKEETLIHKVPDGLLIDASSQGFATDAAYELMHNQKKQKALNGSAKFQKPKFTINSAPAS